MGKPAEGITWVMGWVVYRELGSMEQRDECYANDAEAICEAMSRPNMRFVKVKTVEQQDVQAIHCVRSELFSQRTAKINQIRGLVAEYGLVAPKPMSEYYFR